MGEMTTAGELFLDKIPESLADWLTQRIGDEVIWGAIETGSDRAEGKLWLIATDQRNALAAASKDGRWWQDLPLEATAAHDTRFTKRAFEVDGDTVFEAVRIGGSDLVRLFELTFRPRTEGLFEAAMDHLSQKKWDGADALFALVVDAIGDVVRPSEVAYLNLSQKARLRRAQCALEGGREGEAVAWMIDVSAERPGDNLVGLTTEMHGVEGWFLALALAHDEAGDPASAATVYERLYNDDPNQDLYLLSEARAHRRANANDAAVEAYGAFVRGRESDDFSLVRTADTQAVEPNKEFVEACLESGELLTEMGRNRDAALRYLTLIRNAPFLREGFVRLFDLQASLPADWTVQIAGEVFRLVQPDEASAIDDLPARHEPVELPFGYAPLDDTAHDEKVVHAGERSSTTLAQKWLGALTSDERDTADIERHARRVDGSKYPTALALLDGISAMLGVEPPRLFLSYGAGGIDVLGTKAPFILLGACHLDPDDARALPDRELAFALGSQIEHIKANHLILTSSEFWKTFGTKSATALLAFVPMGDLIGKFADLKMLSWVGKLKDKTEATSRLSSLLDVAEKRLNAGEAREGMQSAYTAALAKVRNVALEEEVDVTQPSMVKEQLANFARAAQYTADRAGLLASDDLATAVRAMLRLSPSVSEHADSVDEVGLEPVLAARTAEGGLVHEELVLRCGELIKFALSADYAELRQMVVEGDA